MKYPAEKAGKIIIKTSDYNLKSRTACGISEINDENGICINLSHLP